MSVVLRIEKLGRSHNVEAFDCEEEELNRFLARYAMQNQQAGSSKTYVALNEDEVVGYYTLVVGQVEYEESSERLKKGLARHPVPLMILARLAVGKAWKGKGLGSGLLKDAMLRTLRAADIAGIRALLMHAKDEKAKSFYEHFGFEAAASDPLHLYWLLKDIRADLRESG